MNNHWIRVAIVATLFAVAAPLAHADDDGGNGGSTTVAPLTGETLLAQEIGQGGGDSTVTGTCIPGGTSMFEFEVNGTATGPAYPGTFTESGTIVFGPSGTTFQSSFTIDAVDGSTVVGSKTLELLTPAPPPFVLCTAIPPVGPIDPPDAVQFSGMVSYSATITTPLGSGMDSGESFVNFQDFQHRGTGLNGFSFSETFMSTQQGPGDDDDDDDGEDDDDDDDGDDGNGDG